MTYRGISLRWVGLMENGYKELEDYYYIVVSENGTIYDCRKRRELKKNIDSFGYETVSIGKKNYYVHRLVAMLYVQRDEENESNIVCHINKNRRDNRAKNLIWVNNSFIGMRRKNFKRNNKGKTILAYKGNKLYGIYKNSGRAEKALGVHRSEVHRCCKGIRKTTGGFRFEYSKIQFDDFIKELEQRKKQCKL